MNSKVLTRLNLPAVAVNICLFFCWIIFGTLANFAFISFIPHLVVPFSPAYGTTVCYAVLLYGKPLFNQNWHTCALTLPCTPFIAVRFGRRRNLIGASIPQRSATYNYSLNSNNFRRQASASASAENEEKKSQTWYVAPFLFPNILKW